MKKRFFSPFHIPICLRGNQNANNIILFLVLILPLSLVSFSYAQEKPKFLKNLNTQGYVKYMQTITAISSDDIIIDNLIHNRLNFKYYANSNLTLGLEFRNRIFYGEQTKLNSTNFEYGKFLETDPGIIDLNFLWVDVNSIKALTIIDRAWIDWYEGDWQVRVGRQRINWGMAAIWNPNDWFNTYSFFDFDYEERPGADAILVQYFTGTSSNVQLAMHPGANKQDDVIAGMYQFNKWKYDFQVLGGLFQSDAAIGAGWAGNIRDAGIKGELSYFHPIDDYGDTFGIVSATISVDYTFSNGLYTSLGYLYSGSGISVDAANFNLAAADINPLLSFQQSAKNLSFFTHNIVTQVAANFTPLLIGSFATIYYPKENLAFLGPTLTYSLKQNLDLMGTAQILAGKLPFQPFSILYGSAFFRLKWSF